MWWAYELLACLKFIAVTGDKGLWYSKRVYELVIPAVLALFIVAAYILKRDLFVPHILENLSSNVFQFMVFVVPFHLAALGAFATFSGQGLDDLLSGTNARLRVWSNEDQEYFYKDLTLRQYGSLLFGYLCSIGVIYILIYLIVSSISAKIALGEWFESAYTLAFILLIFFVLHYVVLTIYAITFLFDKVNKIQSR